MSKCFVDCVGGDTLGCLEAKWRAVTSLSPLLLLNWDELLALVPWYNQQFGSTNCAI